ncbi:hypothetical protein E2562_036663 [Oryza meyeriana var. granulata]|uniref:Uncharacterized protein n=1 Tax=Oryza meyeriana var. granulata TaxID=110450 RepID=A0A6G1FGJ9_9ORYZ|nr:hypothetical protein E2562_036663 [Oryza meyeriana var. granulata]
MAQMQRGNPKVGSGSLCGQPGRIRILCLQSQWQTKANFAIGDKGRGYGSLKIHHNLDFVMTPTACEAAPGSGGGVRRRVIEASGEQSVALEHRHVTVAQLLVAIAPVRAGRDRSPSPACTAPSEGQARPCHCGSLPSARRSRRRRNRRWKD